MKKARTPGGPFHCQEDSLERGPHYATDAASRLHQVHGLTGWPDDRHVALCQQVAKVHQRFHVTWHEMHAWQRLAHEDVEESVGLSRRGIEKIDRRQGIVAACPAIGSDPARFGARDGTI